MELTGSIFEGLMLICFGASWPISIFKTLRSKTVKGVTPFFYILVFVGYLSGTVYKYFYNRDMIIILYLINCCTVGTQIVLYFYYFNKERKLDPPQYL